MINNGSNSSQTSKSKSIKDILDTKEYRAYKEKKAKSQKRRESFYKISSIGNSENSVKYLIVANVIAYIISYYIFPSIIGNFALYNVTSPSFSFYQILTSMFLHGSLMHIIFNMLALWSIGNSVVQTIGDKKFLQLYFISGILGGILCMLFSSQPVVGASGAICGLLSAMAVLSPDSKVSLFFIIPINLKKFSLYFLIFSGVFGILSMINPLYGFGIAHFGHFGGLLGGYLVMLYWKKKLNF